jgi:DNA-binding transcriptional regulator YhcF (GntR family)
MDKNVESEEKEVGPKKHRIVKQMIKNYVENPGNFPEGSKLISEIARDLDINPTTVAKNLKIMFYKGEFEKRVTMVERARFTLVHCAKSL